MLVLIAPDSFKGSLTSVQVARAVADGWSRGRPGDSVVLCPLADGGEGTAARYEQTLSLPQDIDAGAIDARLLNGVLDLTIPKPEQAKPRRVTVTRVS